VAFSARLHKLGKQHKFWSLVDSNLWNRGNKGIRVRKNCPRNGIGNFEWRAAAAGLKPRAAARPRPPNVLGMDHPQKCGAAALVRCARCAQAAARPSPSLPIADHTALTLCFSQLTCLHFPCCFMHVHLCVTRLRTCIGVCVRACLHALLRTYCMFWRIILSAIIRHKKTAAQLSKCAHCGPKGCACLFNWQARNISISRVC